MGFGSEEQFVRAIQDLFPIMPEHQALGIGDDCAVINTPGRLAVSTDLLVEDVHFRRSYFSPEDIGHKALAVNLSDLAGMGAKPLGFSLAMGCPRDLDREYWTRLLSGMSALAARHGLALTGGDLSRSDKMVLSVTIWGGELSGHGFIQRGGARPGDVIFTTGRTGMARIGLGALETLGPSASELYPQCVAAHLRPRPMVAEGLALAKTGLVRGLMDVSDGLARDIPRLLGSGLGAMLDIPDGFVHPEVETYCRATGEDPAQTATMGGEDYALVATAAQGDIEPLAERLEIHVLGQVTEGQTLTVNGAPFTSDGFDHFSREAE